ncbi:MAG: hypothetical protein ACYDD4_03195 [Acidimicrobiales bacterium]
MRTRSTALIPTLVCVLAVGITACGSSGPSAQPPNPATSNTQIAAAYEGVFNFTDKQLASKEAHIQDGRSIDQGLSAAANSSLSSGIGGASVQSTSILNSSGCTAAKVSSPCASVSYSILGTNGVVLYGGQKGYAVYVGGKWLMAKTTICNLLTLFWNASGKQGSPPGC